MTAIRMFLFVFALVLAGCGLPQIDVTEGDKKTLQFGPHTIETISAARIARLARQCKQTDLPLLDQCNGQVVVMTMLFRDITLAEAGYMLRAAEQPAVAEEIHLAAAAEADKLHELEIEFVKNFGEPK